MPYSPRTTLCQALPSTGDTVIGINLKVFKYQSPEHVDMRRQVKQALRSRRNTIEVRKVALVPSPHHPRGKAGRTACVHQVGGTSYTVLTGADGVTSFSNSEGKIVYKSQEEFERSFGSKVPAQRARTPGRAATTPPSPPATKHDHTPPHPGGSRSIASCSSASSMSTTTRVCFGRCL